MDLERRVVQLTDALQAARSGYQQVLEKRGQLSLEGGRAGLGEDSMGADLARLRGAMEEAEFERRIMQVRRDAIEEQIVKLIAQVDERVANDAVVRELERSLATHEDLYGEMHERLKATGMISRAEDNEARLRMVEARVSLSEHRQAIADRVGGGLVLAMRGELVQLEIEMKVQAARSVFLEERLARKSSLAEEIASRRAAVEKELADHQSSIRELEVQRASLGEQLLLLQKASQGR